MNCTLLERLQCTIELLEKAKIDAEKCQLKCDTKLKLQENQYKLQLDLQERQIKFLSRELDRTNDLLIETQEQKTMGDLSPVVPMAAFLLGVLTTTAIVYALNGGDPL